MATAAAGGVDGSYGPSTPPTPQDILDALRPQTHEEMRAEINEGLGRIVSKWASEMFEPEKLDPGFLFGESDE